MSRARTTPRHQSRRAALQVLYAADLSRAAGRGAPSVEEVFGAVCANFDLPGGAQAFAKDLVIGVAASAAVLDALIAEHASHWRIERMAAVDRNVLRLAAFELTRTQTPTRVILDEAIELARQFGTDASPGFVNGVLDALARSVREEDRPGS